ncbi:MAG: outer membrane beta-barrel protein [Tabrizicola sp.]
MKMTVLPLRRVVTSCALVMGLAATPAPAQDWYAGFSLGGSGAQSAFSGGVGEAEAEYDPGIALIGFVGREIAPQTRLEAQLFHASLDVANIDRSIGTPDGGQLHSGGLFLNLIRDFPTGGSLTPYAGIGVGAVNLRYDLVRDLDGGTLHRDAVRAAGQVILGASVPVRDDWSVFGDLRAVWVEDLDGTTSTGAEVTAETSTQLLTIGLMRRF